MTVKWAEPRRLKPGQLVCFFGELTFNPDFWVSDATISHEKHRRARPGELFMVLEDVSTGDLLHVVDHMVWLGLFPILFLEEALLGTDFGR